MKSSVFFVEKIKTKVFLLALLLVNFLVNAQPNQEAKQQMEVQYGNFTSFAKAEKNTELWAKYNSSVYKNHPEFGKTPFNGNYPGYVEVLEKRQIDERYFVNEKNPKEFYLQKAYGALHYQKNNQWVTIDHHITDKGNGIYEAEEQTDPVGFDVNKNASYIKTPNGAVYFNSWKLYGRDNQEHDNLLATANWTNYTVGEDGLYIKNIFPGIDAQMLVNRGSVKTNFVVKEFSYSGYTYLIFKDEMNAPYASALNFSNGANNISKAASDVTLKE